MRLLLCTCWAAADSRSLQNNCSPTESPAATSPHLRGIVSPPGALLIRPCLSRYLQFSAQHAESSPPELTFLSEKKIDRIEDRLAGIENVLASLSTKLGNLDLQKDWNDSTSQSRSSRVGAARSPGSGLTDAPTPVAFEGESSINSQSDYAREMLAQAIGSTPSIGENKEVKMALTALSEMVSQQSQTISSTNAPIHSSLAEVDHTQLERPPWPIVCKVLDKAISECERSLGCFSEVTNLSRVSDHGLRTSVPVPQSGQHKRNCRRHIPQSWNMQCCSTRTYLRCFGKLVQRIPIVSFSQHGRVRIWLIRCYLQTPIRRSPESTGCLHASKL